MNDEPQPGPASPPAAVDAPSPAPALSRTERRVRASADALRTLLRDLHIDRHGVDASAGDIELTLRVRVRPSAQWDLNFDPPLVEQLEEQLAEAQALRDAFRRGRIFCFRCNSSDCEHAVPPTPLQVFHGYDETGRPGWVEFQQSLIEARDERVDQLYARPPRVVARLQFGRQLRGRQLSSFGRASRTYAILGQVAAGWFPIPGNADGKLAVTFQLVESRDSAGRCKLGLNLLAALPAGLDLDVMLADGWQPEFYRARGIAQRAVEAAGLRVAGAQAEGRFEEARRELARLPGILHRLVEGLERGHRQSLRRTRHVEQRRQESRPVNKAIEDARAAKADALFVDLKANTFVVCGPKGRAHAFNEAGRHVTSFLLKPDAIEFRLRTERWRRAEEDEYAGFRARLAGEGGGV